MLIVFPDADPHLIELLTDDMKQLLGELGEFKIYEGRPQSNSEFIARVKDADGILLGWSIPNKVMDECPNLRVISFTGIGASNFVDLNYAKSKGITVTNTPGYADNAVAEHTLSLLLSLSKNIPQHHQNISQGVWDQTKTSIELKGKTIGLIGLGGIGQRMVDICKVLGMEVICWTFNPDSDRANRLGITFTDIESLLSTADFVSLHLPLTEETRHLLNKNRLSLMKKNSFLINTSRAEIVDTNYLVELLTAGKIAGAGIDVFDQEPIKDNHPLLSLSNVVLTPHIAYNTPDASKEILKIATNNLLNFFKGKACNRLT